MKFCGKNKVTKIAFLKHFSGELQLECILNESARLKKVSKCFMQFSVKKEKIEAPTFSVLSVKL